jgi:hypothetical protein
MIRMSRLRVALIVWSIAAGTENTKMRRYPFGYSLLTVALTMFAHRASAQTKLATVSLTPYGVMTQGELDKQHPVLNPPPEEKGFVTSGPPGGIAVWCVGLLAVDRAERIYVGLPIWAADFAPKNPLRGTGDKLRLVAVDSSAKVAWSADFPTRSLYRLGLNLAADGAPLIFAGDKLMRLGPDGKATKELAVPNEDEEQYPLWSSTVSTTGRTLRITPGEKHKIFVDTSTLSVIKDCHPDSDIDYGTLTDDMELTPRNVGEKPNVSLKLTQHAFCEKEDAAELPATDESEFVAIDDRQFLAIDEKAISLRQISGKTVWTAANPAGLTSDNHDRRAQLSRDGGRVAVALVKQYQYHLDTMNPTDIRNGTWDRLHTDSLEDSIGIWDVATGHLVGVVPLKGHSEHRMDTPYTQFALSPDGRLLAVLEDGELTAWRLP